MWVGRTRKALGAFCGLALLAAGLVFGAPGAVADPISDAKAQLQQLDDEYQTAQSNYADSEERLAAAQAQQAQLTTDIATQQDQLDAMRPAIAWLVSSQSPVSGFSMATAFLFNDSPDAFLANLTIVSSVNTLLDEQVARYVSNQQRLDDLESTLDTTIQQIQTEKDTQQQLTATAQSKVAAAQRLLSTLTAAQQAAIGASAANGTTAEGPPIDVPDGAFIWPVDGFLLTSPFGWRTNPIYGTPEFHAGLDLAKPCDSPIVASGDGFVSVAGWTGDLGNYVEIIHAQYGFSTGYGHQSRVMVQVGQQVKQGDIIGYVGSTGFSTGCHVHFQAINGLGQYFDPTTLIH
ncbi:MAG: M23 family metallopeptidase [Propionibacteriaceae bacterium]|nr:M23 family metallopeptidase [Propionibacteriaceae bacterium]